MKNKTKIIAVKQFSISTSSIDHPKNKAIKEVLSILNVETKQVVKTTITKHESPRI